MSDLVERLRNFEGDCFFTSCVRILDEAADRIEELERGERASWSTIDAWKEKAESLEAKNARLRDLVDAYDAEEFGRVAELRAALAAAQEKGDE